MLNLKEINARCEAATEGEWEVVYTHGWALGVGINNGDPDSLVRIFDMVGNTLRKNTKNTRSAQDKLHHNAQFIAHARTDIPALCDEVERLESALRALYNDCRNEPCDEQRRKAMQQAYEVLEQP